MKKKYRIKKNLEFTRIIKENNCIKNNRYTVFYDLKREDISRIGLSVSKKLGNAPIRNKIKRQLRMMFIENYNFKDSPLDFIIIVRKDYLNHPYEDNKNDLEKLIKHAIIKQCEERTL